MPIVLLRYKTKLMFYGTLVTSCVAVALFSWNLKVLSDKRVVPGSSPSPVVQQEKITPAVLSATEKEREAEPSPIRRMIISYTPLPSPTPTVPMVSCGLNNNSIYTTMTKAECDQKQAEENERIRNSRRDIPEYTLPSFSIAPYPSIEPYKPSQEYQDLLNKNMQDLNKKWESSQFVAPSPNCNPVGDGFNCF